jgi:hypothetical protein
MNERIKELILQSVTFRLDPDSECYEAQICPEDLEGLAESIVQEVIYDCMNTVRGENVIRVSMVAKHWGVEV